MEQNFKCSGNCLQCQPAQRAYCASQHAYSNMKVLDQVMGIIIIMQGDMKEMKGKIEALQNNEAMVFAPDIEEKSEFPINPDGSSEKPTDHDIAQSGDGADSRSPETN